MRQRDGDRLVAWEKANKKGLITQKEAAEKIGQSLAGTRIEPARATGRLNVVLVELPDVEIYHIYY